MSGSGLEFLPCECRATEGPAHVFLKMACDFQELDFGSAAKITLFASDVEKGHGRTFSTAC